MEAANQFQLTNDSIKDRVKVQTSGNRFPYKILSTKKKIFKLVYLSTLNSQTLKTKTKNGNFWQDENYVLKYYL